MGQTPLYSAQVIEIKQFQIQSEDNVTGEFAEFVLTGQILEGQNFEAGMKMEILIPEQVAMAGTVSCLPQNCQMIDEKMMSVILEEQIIGPQTLTLNLKNLRNPYSTQTTDSFQLKMSTSQGFLIAKQTKDLTLSVSQGSAFYFVEIGRGSEMNGAQTFYKFSIDLKNPIPNNAVLTILPPAEINVAAQQGTYVDCEGTGNLKSSQLCILSNKQVTLNLQLQKDQLDSKQTIELTIYGVQNPKSIKESGSFQVEILSSDSAYIYSKQSEGITVINSEPNLILIAEIQATNSTLGADSSYTVEFLPANALPYKAVIKVALPDSLTLSTNVELECIGIKNLLIGELECTYDPFNHEVSIQTNLTRVETQPQQTSFEIKGLTNPMEPSFQQSFKIKTYDQELNLIDILPEGVSVTQACDYPCKTCGLSRKTCLSCQLDSIYMYLHDSVCLETCPPGKYGDPNFKCSDCSSSCLQCSSSPSFCTECSDPSEFLHQPSGKCVEACPSGQYKDEQTQQCLSCGDCETCSSLNVCLTCKEGLLLNEGLCREECPISMIPGKDGITCESCQKPCQKCEETVDQCKSCDLLSKFGYLYGFKCLEECPNGHLPSLEDGSTCELVTEEIVPFVFLSLCFVVILIIGASKLFCMKKLHYKNTLIALLTVICQANWFYLVYLTVKDNMWQSTVVLLYGISSNYILNALFFCLYWKVMRQDKYYMQWREGKTRWECLLVLAALLTSFQLYRIIFQQLSKAIKVQKEKVADEESATKKYKFQDENTVKSIFNKLTVIMISCVLAPVIVQNIYNLFFTHPGRQLWWQDIESIVITTFLLVIMAYDSAKKTSKIEAKKLQTPVQAANSAGIPVDLAEKDLQVKQLHEMFQSTKDVKKFRDILMTMMQAQGSKLHFSSGSELEPEETNTFGRRPRNLSLAVADDYRQVPVDTTKLTAHKNTEADFLAPTDRHLLSRTSARGENIFSKPIDFERNFRSPINEQDIEDRKSENENVQSTSRKENLSTVGRDLHQDVNREQIHGMPDTGQLTNVGLLTKLSGNENVRESAMVGGQKNDTNDTIRQQDKLQDRLDGEVRKSLPGNPNGPNQISRNPTHFSILSASVENSLDQREGGQQFTRSDDNQDMTQILVLDQQSPSQELLAKAKFKINMIQIDEVQSNNKEQSPSDSKESPIYRKIITEKKSSICSPQTEDYIKDDIEMLSNNLKKFEKIAGPSQKDQALAIINKQIEKPFDQEFQSGRGKTFASRPRAEFTEQKLPNKFDNQAMGNERPLTAEIIVQDTEDMKKAPKNVLLREQKWMVSTFDHQIPSKDNSVLDHLEQKSVVQGPPESQDHLSAGRLKSRERKDTLIKQLFNQHPKDTPDGGLNFDERFKFFADRGSPEPGSSPGKSLYLSSGSKSFSPKQRLQYQINVNGTQDIVDTQTRFSNKMPFPEAYVKLRQSSKYASDFKRDYRPIPEEVHVVGQGIIDGISSRKKSTLMSQKDEKRSKDVAMPSISRTSSQLAPIMRIGSKNAQELMYMERISRQELMSPDLKLDDLNKNITFAKRSDKKSYKSKTSRRYEPSAEDKIETDAKKRNSKSHENLDLNLPQVDHHEMLYPNAHISPRLGKHQTDQDILDKMLMKADVVSKKSGHHVQETLQERISSGNKVQRSARQKIGQEIIGSGKREASVAEACDRGKINFLERNKLLAAEKKAKSTERKLLKKF